MHPAKHRNIVFFPVVVTLVQVKRKGMRNSKESKKNCWETKVPTWPRWFRLDFRCHRDSLWPLRPSAHREINQDFPWKNGKPLTATDPTLGCLYCVEPCRTLWNCVQVCSHFVDSGSYPEGLKEQVQKSLQTLELLGGNLDITLWSKFSCLDNLISLWHVSSAWHWDLPVAVYGLNIWGREPAANLETLRTHFWLQWGPARGQSCLAWWTRCWMSVWMQRR